MSQFEWSMNDPPVMNCDEGTMTVMSQNKWREATLVVRRTNVMFLRLQLDLKVLDHCEAV